MLEKNTIQAVVVTYHPDSSFARRFECLTQQVDRVLIVDNDSGPAAVAMLREVADRLNMDLILNAENVGVATALNIGIAHAVAHGYEWVLLFDQDTLPGDNMVEGLLEAYNAFPQKDRLAIIGCNYRLQGTQETRIPETVAKGCRWQERKLVITSGSLLSLRVYGILGPFRDEYFIDSVDLEYCLRARSAGFGVIITAKSLMVHGIGRLTRHRLPWREIDVSNHSRLRWYYMIRNDMDMTKKYLLGEPGAVLASLWTRVKSMLVACIFEEDRLAKVWYSAMGMVDGLHSKFDRRMG